MYLQPALQTRFTTRTKKMRIERKTVFKVTQIPTYMHLQLKNQTI